MFAVDMYPARGVTVPYTVPRQVGKWHRWVQRWVQPWGALVCLGVVWWEVGFICHLHTLGSGPGFPPFHLVRDVATLVFGVLMLAGLLVRTLRLRHPWHGVRPWNEDSYMVLHSVRVRALCIGARVGTGLLMSHPRIQSVWRQVVPVSLHTALWAWRSGGHGHGHGLGGHTLGRMWVFGYTEHTLGVYLVWVADVCWHLVACLDLWQTCTPGKSSVVTLSLVRAYLVVLGGEVAEVALTGASLTVTQWCCVSALVLGAMLVVHKASKRH